MARFHVLWRSICTSLRTRGAPPQPKHRIGRHSWVAMKRTDAVGRQRTRLCGLLPVSRSDLAIASAVTAVEVVQALFVRDGWRPVFRPSPELLFLSVLLGLVFLVLLTLVRKARGDMPAERARQSRRERAVLAEGVRVAERARLHSELHDVVGHQVSRMVLAAGALELTAEQGAETVRAQARTIGATGRLALHEMRNLVGRPGRDGLAWAPPSTAAGIEQLVEHARALGRRVTVHMAADVDALPEGVRHSLYRLIRESLTNVFKHAPGADLTIRVAHRYGWVVVEVVNTVAGCRGSGMPGSGRGLAGLAERIRQEGGVLTAGRLAGGDFRVTASIPVDGDGAWGRGAAGSVRGRAEPDVRQQARGPLEVLS